MSYQCPGSWKECDKRYCGRNQSCADRDACAPAQSTTPASVLPTVARQLPTVAYLSEQYSPSTRWTTDNWVSVATTYNPTDWDGFRNVEPLCKASDAEAAISQARQDERERAFRAGWESAAALQYVGDGDDIPPAHSVVASLAFDAFVLGLTDGGNSK